MENNYTNEDILNLFFIHGECNRIIQRTCRTFNERYPHLQPMTSKKFSRMQSNFLKYGNILGSRQIIERRRAQNNEDRDIIILAYFHVHPYASIRDAARDMGMTFYQIQRILKYHKFHNYSLKPVQELYPDDLGRRIEFCENILVVYQNDPSFLSKIIWTDECKFDREGVFNRKNEHYWSENNPHKKKLRNYQRRFSVNVICFMIDNRIHYHIYYNNLNSHRYVEILRTVVTEFLDNLPLNVLQNCWYQLDGAPAHSTGEVENVLAEIFEDRWIGRHGPWRWPARSPDLTPCDFYLWGYIKSKVYNGNGIRTREDLVARIHHAFEELDPNHIRRATTISTLSRITECLNRNGGHIENFK
jgi:hypothetical protein